MGNVWTTTILYSRVSFPSAGPSGLIGSCHRLVLAWLCGVRYRRQETGGGGGGVVVDLKAPSDRGCRRLILFLAAVTGCWPQPAEDDGMPLARPIRHCCRLWPLQRQESRCSGCLAAPPTGASKWLAAAEAIRFFLWGPDLEAVSRGTAGLQSCGRSGHTVMAEVLVRRRVPDRQNLVVFWL